MDNLKSEFVNVNGLNIHYVTVGEGPLVILLHGFPQYWYTWRHQIPVLAKQFRVVAPDLRGYNESDKPNEISAYNSSLVASDIVALIKSLGYEKAHIVGHDWGGAIAWTLAIEYKKIVDKLVVLNCPHPYLFKKALRANSKQMIKSWYVFLFQIPYLPEFIINSFSDSIVKKLFRGTSLREETFSDEDIEHYVKALKKPGAIQGALNYYRAAFKKNNSNEQKDKLITAPTLLIWGEEDSALGKELTYNMEPLFNNTLEIKYIPNCSHWVNEEQPELVNSLILKFLS